MMATGLHRSLPGISYWGIQALSMIKSPFSLSVMYLAAVVLFATAFWIVTTVDDRAALSRFTVLTESGNYGRSITHGEQYLALRESDGADPEELVAIKHQLADAHRLRGKAERAIVLYREVLSSNQAIRLSLAERIDIKTNMAVLELAAGNVSEAAAIYAEFLDSAGDEAARQTPGKEGTTEISYILPVREAMTGFSDAIRPVNDQEITKGTESQRLNDARHMTALGGYYAAQQDGDYAAAGLLSAAYQARLNILGAADRDTLQTALLLGPVYQKIGRTKDAETLYLSALNAQERTKGSNSPELSLYIRLLADVYKEQQRFTEAEALNTHIQRLFKDAFGARRYVSSQARDRRMDVNRPVSASFPLNGDYTPDDLVAAIEFDVPLSKNPSVEEMSIRRAEELNEASGVTMPSELAGLLQLCEAESGESLSLRSGYRSYKTQTHLYQRLGHKGTVTSPGTSEHQTGLAADIDVNKRLMRQTDRAYQCFEENAWQFGFILTYPQGNTYLPGPDSFEPWHWRYVGKQTALLYREAGPLDKPQEFLAALPCYEERATAGIWSIADETDVCLESVNVNLSSDKEQMAQSQPYSNKEVVQAN